MALASVTSCLEQFTNAVSKYFFNTNHPTYWSRRALFMIIELGINIAQLVEAWTGDLFARWFVLLAVILACVEIPQLFLTRAECLEQKKGFEAALSGLEVDEKGYIPTEQLSSLQGSFDGVEFYPTKRTRINLDDLLRLKRKTPSRDNVLTIIGFIESWLSFWASLMLFPPGTSPDAITIMQGVLGIFDVSLIVFRSHRIIMNLYEYQHCIIRWCSLITFGYIELSIFGLLNASYAIVAALYSMESITLEDAGIVPAEDTIGFYMGLGMFSLVILWTMAIYFTCQCMNACGCVKYGVRRPLGNGPQVAAEYPSAPIVVAQEVKGEA